MIHIGRENYLGKDLVAVILQPDSSHAKRVRDKAEDMGKLVNATSGNRVKSVIVLVTSQVVLSALKPVTIKDRIEKDAK